MSSVHESDPLLHGDNKRVSVGNIILVIVALLGIAGFTTYAILTTDDVEATHLEVVYTQRIELDSYSQKVIIHLTQKFNQTLADRVRVKVHYDSDHELTVRIADADNPGFALPEDSPYLPNDKNSKDTKDGKRNYRVDLKTNGQFTIYRTADGKDIDTIFDTVGHQLLVSDQYTQFATTLNSKYLYGLGERRKELRYKGSGNYTTWPKDQFGTNDYGKPGSQLYGYHPMWLTYEQSGNFHVGFLKSTSALLTEVVEGERMIFHVVGGSIFLKFFIGDTNPESVIKSYHRFINGFGLHPFWAQGYHQCRWGYKTSADMLTVVDKFAEIGHPLESMWNDLDYMTAYQVFTLDTVHFKKTEMDQLIARTTPKGVHWVPLVDIGIATGTEAETLGNTNNIFLKSAVYNDTKNNPLNLEGCVWPGAVVFPDFNNPKAQEYWTNCSLIMRDKGMEPSGWWIDMNEMASFIPGERNTVDNENCYGANPPSPPPVKGEIDDRLWFPVEVTGGQPLAHKTASLNAKHYGGDDGVLLKTSVQEQYFHSLNNLGEQIATHKTLKQFTGKNLTFSLTRASIYGSGRYTALWTGDNVADWEFLRLGVSELLSMQFFGIPLVGNDLCGFAGNTNPELCARWLALGAWEPFARNHNDNESISQEPYVFTDDPYVQEASLAAFKNRYELLKWMYSLFVAAYEPDLGAGTGTIIQPIWWNNPTDKSAYDFEDSEFLFGNTFLVAPVLSKSTDAEFATKKSALNVYFPKGSWLSCDDFTTVYEGEEGKSVKHFRSFNQQAISYQKEGTLVFRQTVQTRARLLDSNFSIRAFLNKDGIATGQILTLADYDENNVEAKCWVPTSNCVATYTLKQTDGKLILSVKGQNDKTVFEKVTIQNVYVYVLNDKKSYTYQNVNIDVVEAKDYDIPQ